MDKFKYYLKKYQFLVYLVGLVLAVIGSIEVFWGQYDNLFKQIWIVIFSVIKLFLFQPLQAVTNANNPLIYDLAIIIAPIGTVIGLFSVFDTLYQNLRLKMIHLNQKHLVVLGSNDLAIEFMMNSKQDHKILCITDQNTSQDLIDTLSREGILVSLIDYSRNDGFENKKMYQHHSINKAIALISFEEEPMNYGHLEVISNLQMDYPEVLKVYVHYQNIQLKEVIQKPMDQFSNLDIHYFNLELFMSFDLFNNENFSLKDLSDLSKANIHDKDDLSRSLGRVHLLLIGFDSMGQAIFRSAVNQATINPYQNLQVTIVDPLAKQKFDEFESQFTHLNRVADFNLINASINSTASLVELSKLFETEPFTSVIYTLKDSQTSLLSIERLSRYFKDNSVAIYTHNYSSIKPLADALKVKYHNLVFYGELNHLLNNKRIMDDSNYQKAKAFNAYYNEVAQQLLNWPPSERSVDEQWLAISNVKKESSFYQALHRQIKLDILTQLSRNESLPDSVTSILEFIKSKLTDKTVQQQNDLIEEDVLLNFLSALEHKRWNNFYYMQDFVYGEQTDELLKVHNCLIDDWDYFFKVQKDKVIYDLLSWLSLDEKA